MEAAEVGIPDMRIARDLHSSQDAGRQPGPATAWNYLETWLLGLHDNPAFATMRAAGTVWTRVMVPCAGTETSGSVHHWTNADS